MITKSQAIKSLDNTAEFSIRDGVITWITAPIDDDLINDEVIRLQAETIESNRVQSIKNEAQKRIIGLAPAWTTYNHEQKQRNALMGGFRVALRIFKALNTTNKALNSGVQADIDAAITATDSEIAKADAAIAVAIKIKAIRDMSNLAETNGDSLTQFIVDLDAAGY
jgi:hypothetical protein